MTDQVQDHAVQRFIAGLPLNPEQEEALSDMMSDAAITDTARDLLINELRSPSADTRLNAVRAAGQHRDWLPDFILDAIKEMTEKDSDPAVRELAARVVDDWDK